MRSYFERHRKDRFLMIVKARPIPNVDVTKQFLKATVAENCLLFIKFFFDVSKDLKKIHVLGFFYFKLIL